MVTDSFNNYSICEGDPYSFMDSFTQTFPDCYHAPYRYVSFYYYDSLNPYDDSHIFYDTVWNQKKFTVYDFPLGVSSVNWRVIDSSGIILGGARYLGALEVIGCPPVSNFTFDIDTICSEKYVTYFDKSIRKPTTWHWLFQGGIPFEFYGQHPPPIFYSVEGHFITNLVTSNNYGVDFYTATKEVHVYNCSKCIYFPNAFSPNGDGNNEYFETFCNCPTTHFRLLVFNRWGEVMFSTENQSDNWDGTFKGAKLDTQMLIYLSSITYADNRTENYKGSIMLIR